MALINPTDRTRAEDVDRALDPAVKGSELVVLAAHRDLAVRAAVASRADAPMASLIALAHERDIKILEALSFNPSSPLWVLQKLAVDRHSQVRARAIQRLRAIDIPA